MASILDQRVPLSRIHQLEDISPNMKRNILISHQKLPKDFFPTRNILRLDISESKNQSRNRPILLSQNIRRNFSQINQFQQTPKRESMTARQSKTPRQEDLIMGIISASRQMKRVIRKHSMELKKKQNKVNEFNFQINKKYGAKKEIQLPPLFFKKGVTTPF